LQLLLCYEQCVKFFISYHVLSVPQHDLSFGSRAFRISAPKIWNSLHLYILQSQTFSFIQTLFKDPVLSVSLSCSLLHNPKSPMHPDFFRDYIQHYISHLLCYFSALTVCVCAALQFSQTLADLETAQHQVTTHLKSHTDVVKQVTVYFIQYNMACSLVWTGDLSLCVHLPTNKKRRPVTTNKKLSSNICSSRNTEMFYHE